MEGLLVWKFSIGIKIKNNFKLKNKNKKFSQGKLKFNKFIFRYNINCKKLNYYLIQKVSLFKISIKCRSKF